MWVCTTVEHVGGQGSSCQHCGHGIKNVFYIRNVETGATMEVGSECVKHFVTLPDEVFSAKRREARVKRAIRQWNANKELRKPGETREEFINRRVREMANALAAFSAMNAWFGRKHSVSWGIHQAAKQWLRDNGYYDLEGRRTSEDHHEHDKDHNGEHPEFDYIKCSVCAQQKALYAAQRRNFQMAREAVLQEFADQHGANVFDFNRLVWEVRKI